jgi:hypothetical protein
LVEVGLASLDIKTPKKCAKLSGEHGTETSVSIKNGEFMD